MIAVLVALVACAVGDASLVYADATTLPRSVLPASPVVDRLPNGLTVVTVDTGPTGIVAYYTLVRVGSRDEVEPGRTGFAHLFEHMMFRGTEARPGPVYERTMQGFGADNNAYTTSDYTLYTITGAERCARRRSSRSRPSGSSISTSTRRLPYRGRRRARRVRDHRQRADRDDVARPSASLAFGRHTYGHTTIGHLARHRGMNENVAYARDFFRRYYTPDDTTLFVVGDVRHDALLALVRVTTERGVGRATRPRFPASRSRRAVRAAISVWPGAAEPSMFVAYRTPAFVGEGDRSEALRTTAALEIVHALAFSESSPLYASLVEQERVALELGSWEGDFSRDPALFVVTATLADPTKADRILEAIEAELRAVERGERDGRFEDARSFLRYDRIASLRTVDDVAEQLAQVTAASGEVGSLAEYVDALDHVRIEDVRRVAAEYLVASRRFVVTLRGGAETNATDAHGSMCDHPAAAR